MAAMALHERVDERQTEARALLPLGREEGLEDVLLDLGWDARPIVGHAHPAAAVRAAGS